MPIAAALLLGVLGQVTPAPNSILQLVQRDGRFKMLSQLLHTTGLDHNLSGHGGPAYTLIAPTDAAFNKLPLDARKAVLNQDRFGASIIGGHLLNGKYGTMSFTNGISPQGQPLRHHLKSFGETYIDTESTAKGLTINGAKVIGELFAGNGIILVVDRVLPVVIDAPRSSGFSRVLPAEILRWGLGKYRPRSASDRSDIID